MDKKRIKDIAKEEINNNFPEMKGIEPEIEKINTDIGTKPFKKAGIPFVEGKDIWVATFKKREKTEEGLPINRVVRVTMDSTGKKLKITESK